MMNKSDIDKITHTIIGCAIKVHNTLGNGFQEITYHKALAIEMSKQALTFQKEIEIPIIHSEIKIGSKRVDFFVESVIMVEIKTIGKMDGIPKNQAMNYCEAFNTVDSLLINFGAASLEFNRIYNKKLTKPLS